MERTPFTRYFHSLAEGAGPSGITLRPRVPHRLARSSRLTCVGVRETREVLSGGRSSVVEHVESVLAAIREIDAGLGAFVSIAGDRALREAEVADERVHRYGAHAWQLQPLLGITVAVKDLIQTRDLPTRRGSLLANHRTRADAPAVARLQKAGAIVVGKTTTSEHGWSASTLSRVGPPTRNPWHHGRSAGGSSGGSAAAVAAGLCTAALGTDGAGSIRIPAAFCGVVGYKPSFGHVPYFPPGADRLAHTGPIASSVGDAIELVDALAGPHPDDPDSGAGSPAPQPHPPSLRVGWIELPGTSSEVRRVTERVPQLLADQGHRVDAIDVPFPDPYPALVDILAATEAAGTAPVDEQWCDPDRLSVIHHGRALTGVELARAEQMRMALRVTLRAVMERYDLLAMATVPIEPFEADAIGPPWAADPTDLQWLAWSPATYPFNLTGQPALSLPAGLTSSGLPVGLQLVGAVGRDRLLLAAAGRIEADLGRLPAAPELVMRG